MLVISSTKKALPAATPADNPIESVRDPAGQRAAVTLPWAVAARPPAAAGRPRDASAMTGIKTTAPVMAMAADIRRVVR